MATMNSLQTRGDRDLARLDAICGKDATYYVSLGETLDDDGNIVRNHEITEGVRVRMVELTARELNIISASGIEQFDAVWRMRRIYYPDPRPDHILKIEDHYYEIVDKGVRLDALELLYTLVTRRRPSLA